MHHIPSLRDGCSLSPHPIIEGSQFRIQSPSSQSVTASAEWEGKPLRVILQVKSCG